MGFVDLVGIASNYVKNDLQLSDSTAKCLSVSCLLLVPHLLSADGDVDEQDWAQEDSSAQSHRHLVFIATPHLWRVIRLMLVSFSLLGIGNALMQTFVESAVSTVMKGGNLASTLTFGQFVKAIASFMAPYLAMWGAQASIPAFGLDGVSYSLFIL